MQRLSQLLPTTTLRLSTAFRSSGVSSTSTLLRRGALSNTFPTHARLVNTDARGLHPVNSQLENGVPMPKTIEERWKESSKRALEDARNSPPANPYSGRTVEVGKNLSATFRKLDAILARNQVRKQLRLTERHEKKGVKRRRLSSERWRKRFADEVRKKVQLVIKIKERGA